MVREFFQAQLDQYLEWINNRGLSPRAREDARSEMLDHQDHLDSQRLYAPDVCCNALCPSFIDTPFDDGFERPMGGRSALEDYVARHIPMGRWGTPEEIAQGIVFLASDRSACVTWHALVIGGAECL